MIDRNFLHDSAAHRDAVDMRALDADSIHQADSVVGEELGRIGPVRTISTSSAAIVEAENLEVLRKMFDLTHPGPRVTGKPPNMDERRALTVNLVIHIDVVDANLGACSPPSAGLRFETIGRLGRA